MDDDDDKCDNVVDPRFKEYVRKYNWENCRLHRTSFSIINLKELINALNDPDVTKQHYGIIGIRRILSVAATPPIQKIIDAGVVPKLIELIGQEQYPQLQLEATWALANIAAGSRQQT
jgi:hypothetical protein